MADGSAKGSSKASEISGSKWAASGLTTNSWWSVP